MTIGIAILLLGWAPLVIFGAVEKLKGESGGNPVGFGFLGCLSTGVGLLLLIGGLIADERQRKEKGGTP